MANISTFLRQKLLGVVLCHSPYTAPNTIFISLATSCTSFGDTFIEVPTAWGYGRQVIQFGNYTDFGNGQSQVTNINTVSFPTANTLWLPVPYYGLHDAVSSGDLLYWGTLDNTMNVSSGLFPFVLVNCLSEMLK